MFRIVILLLGIYLAPIQPTQAQLTPEFSFTLYLTDGLGNQDSVVMGYDSLSTYGIDEDFGEMDITNAPYDTVFEVRTFDALGSPAPSVPRSATTMNIIPLEYGEFTQAWGGYISLLIRAKHLPVTFRWDSSLFQGGNKRSSSLFVANNYYYAAPHPDYFPKFLRASDAFREFFAVPGYEYQGFWDEDSAGDSARIYVYHFSFSGTDPVQSIDDSQQGSWRVYPNPAHDWANVQSDAPLTRLSLYDAMGRKVREEAFMPGHEVEWSLAELPPGLYALRGQTIEGEVLQTWIRVE